VPISLSPRVQFLTLVTTVYLLLLALVAEREIGPVTVGGIVVAFAALALSAFLVRREFREVDPSLGSNANQ
jgi:hypothetical protein